LYCSVVALFRRCTVVALPLRLFFEFASSHARNLSDLCLQKIQKKNN
jgi:hypothetical protein